MAGNRQECGMNPTVTYRYSTAMEIILFSHYFMRAPKTLAMLTLQSAAR
jgi:hypothetical protein